MKIYRHLKDDATNTESSECLKDDENLIDI